MFEAMLAKESKIDAMKGWRLVSAQSIGSKPRGITIVNRHSGEENRLTAKVFVEANYEGDLFAAAGLKFRPGRESRAEFDEPDAGVVYFDQPPGYGAGGESMDFDDGIASGNLKILSKGTALRPC